MEARMHPAFAPSSLHSELAQLKKAKKKVQKSRPSTHVLCLWCNIVVTQVVVYAQIKACILSRTAGQYHLLPTDTLSVKTMFVKWKVFHSSTRFVPWGANRNLSLCTVPGQVRNCCTSRKTLYKWWTANTDEWKAQLEICELNYWYFMLYTLQKCFLLFTIWIHRRRAKKNKNKKKHQHSNQSWPEKFYPVCFQPGVISSQMHLVLCLSQTVLLNKEMKRYSYVQCTSVSLSKIQFSADRSQSDGQATLRSLRARATS